MTPRILTGLILGGAVACLLLLAPPVATYVLIQAGAWILADEFYRMAGAPSADRWAGIAASVALTAVVWWAPSAFVGAVYLGVVLLLVSVLFSREGVEVLGPRALRLLAGYGYVGLLSSAMTTLARVDHPPGPHLIFVLFCGVFAGDTGAFFAGKAFGRHKLYEKISPKKTWEGAAGGAVGTVALLVGMDQALSTGIGVGGSLVLGVLIAAFGQVGDLAESLFKRHFGVKDSGTLLPGHGGLLDRVDGVLFAAPVMVLWLAVVV